LTKCFSPFIIQEQTKRNTWFVVIIPKGIMKIKENVDLSALLQEARRYTSKFQLRDVIRDRGRIATNFVARVLELEPNDFARALNITTKYKFKSIEEEIIWSATQQTTGIRIHNPAEWFAECVLSDYAKRSTLKRMKYKNEIREEFEKELQQIKDFTKLFMLMLTLNPIREEYARTNDHFEIIMEWSNSGNSAGDFKWSLVEPSEESEE